MKKATFGWFLTGSSLLLACQAVIDGPPTEAPPPPGSAGSAISGGSGGTVASGSGGLSPGSGGSVVGTGGSGGSTTLPGAGRPNAGAGSGVGGATSTGGTGMTGTGPLCDVLALLRQKCQSCHSSPPAAGIPMALASYADLVAPSPADPSVSTAEMSIQRMQGMGARMPPPPGTPATAADVQVLQGWIDAGEPSTCDSGTAGAAGSGGATGTGGTAGSAGAVGNPYDTPLVCTSNQHWTGGNRESADMHPGGTCINCHSSGEGPSFTFAGTVFPSAHEPDDCNGLDGMAAMAQVIVTDANNATFTMTVNSVGNFYYSGRTAPAMPYTAKVVSGGNERIMTAQQTTGDCNSCHTQNGANDAPGRIMAP